MRKTQNGFRTPGNERPCHGPLVLGPGIPNKSPLMTVELRGLYQPGLGKLGYPSLSIGQGNDLPGVSTGAVGPTTAGHGLPDTDSKKLVKRRARGVAPQGSALSLQSIVLARLGGRISEVGGLVAIDEIALRTAYGQGSSAVRGHH